MQNFGQKYRIKEYKEIIEEVNGVVNRWSKFAIEVGIVRRSREEIVKML